MKATFLLLVLTSAALAHESTVVLKVKTRNERGVVRCALFARESKWLEEPLRHASATISGEQAACRFDGVAPGTYAIVAFHDENSNEKLDFALFGVPREGYAASNGAHRVLGPPTFQDARFELKSGNLELRAKMSYLVP